MGKFVHATTNNDEPGHDEEGRDEEHGSLVGCEFDMETDSVATPATNVHAEVEAQKIATREARWVSRCRLLIFVFLVLGTAAVSVGIFWNTSQAEEDEFQAAFGILADQIGNGWRNHVALQLGALDSLGISITSSNIPIQSNGSGSFSTTWPLITVTNFEKQGLSFRRNTGAQSIVLLPLVNSTEMRGQWELFALEQSREWITQGLEFEIEHSENLIEDGGRRRRSLLQDPTYIVDGLSSTIYSFDENANATVRDTSPPPFLPGWQSSPVMKNWINFNFASHESIGSAVESVLRYKRPTLSKMIGYNKSTEFLFGGNSPSYSLLYPLFDGFGLNQVVGVLLAQSQWQTSWATSLSPTTDVIFVQIENSCGQLVSFQLSDGSVDYVGIGAESAPYYKNRERSFSLSDLGTGGLRLFSDTDQGLCEYTLRVYPSVEMRNAYITNTPWIYVAAVVAMSSLLLVIFGIYACLADRHQKAVLDAAVRARTIVTSLFPSVVHDRLFDVPGTSNKTSEASLHTPPTNLAPQEQRRSQPPSEVSFSNERDDMECKPSSGILSAASSGDGGGSEPNNTSNDYPDTPRSVRSRIELPKQQIRNFLNEDGPSRRQSDASAHSMDLLEFKKSKPIADLVRHFYFVRIFSFIFRIRCRYEVFEFVFLNLLSCFLLWASKVSVGHSIVCRHFWLYCMELSKRTCTGFYAS